ncbi:MAG: DUF1801 domain-containing protein [Cyclobacteriaceae bacterium]
MAKSVVDLSTSPGVEGVFDNYPKHIQPKMKRLRQLVLDTANEIEGLDKLEETLKWGEPSYLTKHGSTLRMDWKEKKPDQYAMYFKCTSKLVSTFKMIYNDTFKFETTRAIVFDLEDEIPEKELKRCIAMTLTYHKVKHLPMLGG